MDERSPVTPNLPPRVLQLVDELELEALWRVPGYQPGGRLHYDNTVDGLRDMVDVYLRQEADEPRPFLVVESIHGSKRDLHLLGGEPAHWTQDNSWTNRNLRRPAEAAPNGTDQDAIDALRRMLAYVRALPEPPIMRPTKPQAA